MAAVSVVVAAAGVLFRVKAWGAKCDIGVIIRNDTLLLYLSHAYILGSHRVAACFTSSLSLSLSLSLSISLSLSLSLYLSIHLLFRGKSLQLANRDSLVRQYIYGN
jgi:hypothetical protein